MAVTTAVLSGTIDDLIGSLDPKYLARITLVVEANTPGSLLLDTAGNRHLAGAKRIPIDKNTGAYSATLVTTNSADIVPTTGRLYRATLIYPSGTPGAGNVTQVSGWFQFTANASLADIWPGLATTEVATTVYENMTDSLMTGIDSNSASGFRVQQDARLSATYVARSGRNLLGVDGAQLDQALSKLGGYGLFLSTENRPKVIAATDYVLLHSHNVNNANVPRQWGYNPVVVKDIASAGAVGGQSLVIGIEVSVSNNTTVVGQPQATDELTGIYCSYIHTANRASAAFSVGGLSAGWQHGLFIDAIASNGIGIKLVDDVAQQGGGPNGGMSIGLDLSQVSGFTTAAIFLGNAHKVRALTAAAAVRDLIHMNSGDEVVIGDSANNTPVRIYTNALKLNVPTAATATAGTSGAPPAQVQGYFIATSPFGDVKIPFYAT